MCQRNPIDPNPTLKRILVREGTTIAVIGAFVTAVYFFMQAVIK